MRIFTTFLLALLFPVMLLSQKPEILQQHYQNEFNTFREAIARSGSMNPDTTIDVIFYHLTLDISIDEPYLAGIAKCIIEPVNDNLGQFELDLHPSMTVDSVSGPVTNFEHTGDALKIFLSQGFNAGDPVEVVIYYQGEPKLAGGYKGMRYETHGSNEPVIATLSTPFLAHYWFPCKDGPSDKPDSAFIDIIIPDTTIDGVSLKGVSNGILEGVETIGNKRIFKWRHRYPIVTYYMMAAVSNYEIIEDEYTGIYGEQYPLIYYVFNESYNSALAGVEDMPLALDVFSELFGIYPFYGEKYGMTQLGYYGAIENQTNTIINNMSAGWFMISVHELAHMWFGDMITCTDWHHGWLNEGFATYAEALYVESQQGLQAYLDYIDDEQYFQGGTLYVENIQDTFNVFQPLIYSKGAYVLHMLRGVLGDDVFFDGLKNYATAPDLMYGQATTEDLQNVMESTSGMDLSFFFDQWIYDEYYPVYEYNYLNDEISGKSYLSLKQVQELAGRRPVFEMPVQAKLFLQDGSNTIVTLWNDLKVQTFELELESPITFMQFDPEGWLLDVATYDPGLLVGISENKAQSQLWVFPTISENHLEIHAAGLTGNTTLYIYDIDGNKVFHGKFPKANSRIDISNLNSGLHILKVVDSNQVLSAKFIKM